MQQEIDLLELGLQPARCFRGENAVGDQHERISRIAGRAYRGVVEKRRSEFLRQYGKTLPWSTQASR